MCPEAAVRAAMPRRGPARRGARGVTLIELMIVVVVVAVLGAVALPAYQGSVRKAHRTEAKAALTSGAQRMERLYTERGSYASATVGSGSTDTVPAATENGYYALGFSGTPTATAYVLTAMPQGGQTADACGTFTIDQAGTRGVTGGSLTTAECW